MIDAGTQRPERRSVAVSMPDPGGSLTQARALVIIPAFNEEGSIAGVLERLSEQRIALDVLVVNDGSSDSTARVARSMGAQVLDLPFNLGVGGAVRAGYVFAREHEYPVVVQIDADGQHDPREIELLLASLSKADVVIGARFAGAGDYAVRGPRRWAMRVLARVVSSRAHCRLSDVTSGFRATNRRGISVFADHYPAEYLGDTVESLMIALRAGLTIDQVPVSMMRRAHGRSSQSAMRSFVHLVRTSFSVVLALVRQWPQVAQAEFVEQA